jgi:hypothetical protein
MRVNKQTQQGYMVPRDVSSNERIMISAYTINPETNTSDVVFPRRIASYRVSNLSCDR